MNQSDAESPGQQVELVYPDGTPPSANEIRFSIVALVSDMAHYDAFRKSFQSRGFTASDCEYIYIDNTARIEACAYRGLNRALAEARGTFVLLCHQDLRLLTDGRAELEERLKDLDTKDANWALAGNAGGIGPGQLSIRISDPHGTDRHVGNFPCRVQSLDENLIIVRRAARIGFSNDLSGFHFYGADICLHAAQAGYTAYVIDFHLAHLSGGTKDDIFYETERKFLEKWNNALKPRWLQTTCALIRISGDSIGKIAGRFAAKPFAKISRRLPAARGWQTSRSAHN